MKKAIVCLVLVWVAGLSAQNQKAVVDAAYNANELSKSGNYKDVFASLLQLAAKNIVGEDKSIDFNTTLFALKLKANPSLIIDTQYAKERFSRNLQFNFKANFDDNYQYTGATGGITLALYNGRDKTVANFASQLDGPFTNLMDDVIAYRNQKIPQIISANPTDNAQRISELQALDDAINAFLNNQPIDPTREEATTFLQQLQSQSAVASRGLVRADCVSVTTLQDAAIAINQSADLLYAALEGKPLMTMAVNGTSNKEGKFDQAAVGVMYLQGIKKSAFEIDIRAKFKYADTLAISHPRTEFNASAGANYVVGKRNSANCTVPTVMKSSFEIKGYVEYHAVYKNRLPTEQKDRFLACLDLRLHIFKDLWIPFSVKYDHETANLFGFLNVTYNFDAL